MVRVCLCKVPCYNFSVNKSPIIGFNSDEDTKRLTSILAAKNRYENSSQLLRALLKRAFRENFTVQQVCELLSVDQAQANSLLGLDEQQSEQSASENATSAQAAESKKRQRGQRPRKKAA